MTSSNQSSFHVDIEILSTVLDVKQRKFHAGIAVSPIFGANGEHSLGVVKPMR